MSDHMTAYVIIPLLIFFARIIDVSIGTVRVVLLARGNRWLAPLLGFFEVIIWLAAVSKVMQNLTNVVCYIAYGAGFATGNYIGLWLESRLALGFQIVRIISTSSLQLLPTELRNEGYGVTTLEGRGASGPVHIIFSVIARKKVDEFVKLALSIEPNAFISIEDVRSSHSGYLQSATEKRSNRLKKIVKKK
jgi:uncharacterized protein YebE (UPF0316 family)